MNIREALRTAAERLETHRISNARLTAELLLAHSLSVDREYLYAHDDRVLQDNESPVSWKTHYTTAFPAFPFSTSLAARNSMAGTSASMPQS